jgi:DNA polymerase delta subunit 3
MADTYKEYLAARVLTEGKIVTYRLLSRVLKVNVNTAKQMLYDFHTKQNAKKPNSVHATYLFTGKQRPQAAKHTNGTHTQDGEDSIMQSSPFMSSMPEQEECAEEPIPVTAVVLVREEELEKKKSEFAEITSIHVYSLEPGPIENMNMLSVCNQEIVKSYSEDDPLERWRIYGCIHNPHIKRRTTKYAPPQTAKAPASAPKPAARQSTGAAKKDDGTATGSRRESVSEDTKSGRSTPASSSKSNATKKSELKPKKSMSELFKSFAKTKPPKAKEEAEKSKESTPAQTEDEPMQGMSEDEAGDDDAPEVAFDAEKALAARKARADREAKLRKMMDDDDDDDEAMDDAPLPEPDSQDAPLDAEPSPKPTEPEAIVTSQGGRRRGRRRVMKKKTVQDEDGYLVTKEEAVWESFSEDEPEPKKPKPAPKPSTARGKKAGTGTGTGKYGQGNIASFFKRA